MRIVAAITATLATGLVFAKLPPPTTDDMAKAKEGAAKAEWADKFAQYQLCHAMERTADAYRKSAAAAGKSVPEPMATAACSDPGAFASPLTPAAAKPLEAAGAHSPPGTAVSPPSTKATSAELAGAKK